MADAGPILSEISRFEAAVRAEERADAAEALAALQAEFDAYRASHEHEEPTAGKVIIGMSAPRDQWDQRVNEVGPGLGARRIFADLVADGRSQASLIEEALADGLIPVVSYKSTPAGSFPSSSAVAATANYLESLDSEVLATYHHEPWGDFGGSTTAAYAPFRDGSRAFLDAVASDKVKVGPLLNGWLLNNRVVDFEKLVDDDLLARWDFMGIDTYEEGTLASPGTIKPASRIPLLVQWCQDRGIGDKPLVIGEYNGYSGATIEAAGEAILSAPNMWIACMWNSTEGKGYVLTGERLAAFKRTLADPRVY